MKKTSIPMYSPWILMALSMTTLLLTLWLGHNNNMVLLEWELASVGPTPLWLTMILDPKGTLFSSVVLFISSSVLKFSTLYMEGDKNINRFTWVVLLFVLSMNLLIYIPHLMILLLGWDGLGLISFILVIYYQNPKSLSAGMITAITNRIGDVMLLLSIAMTLNQGHWNITNMWYLEQVSTYQVLMITCAAMTKSAQMPFSSWLPAAMAAPTPVSALVHSSTLVTAGVFLLIRFYPFLHKIYWFNDMLLYIAMLTMTMAGLCACVEWDMKKIIALSTLSQLGLMMTSLGLNLHLLTYFHMLVHAMFKALLFVCAGALITNHKHSQDLRWMGNISKQMPTTTSCIVTSNLAMSGFPFMAAFYTKDTMIELTMFNQHATIMMMLLYTSVGITSFYSFRFTMAILWAPSMTTSYLTPTEPKSITTPMLMLALPSITSGMVLWWVYPVVDSVVVMSWDIMAVPTMLMLLGFYLGSFWSDYNMEVEYPTQIMYNSMWYLTPISTQLPMKLYFPMAKLFLEQVDQAWMETGGGLGLNKAIVASTNKPYKIYNFNPISMLILSSTLMMVLASTILC